VLQRIVENKETITDLCRVLLLSALEAGRKKRDLCKYFREQQQQKLITFFFFVFCVSTKDLQGKEKTPQKNGAELFASGFMNLEHVLDEEDLKALLTAGGEIEPHMMQLLEGNSSASKEDHPSQQPPPPPPLPSTSTPAQLAPSPARDNLYFDVLLSQEQVLLEEFAKFLKSTEDVIAKNTPVASSSATF
jgi:hypothetical protein